MALGLLIAALVLPPALIYPGWRRFDATLPEGKLVLLFPAMGALTWLLVAILLSVANIAGGSLSNLVIEIPIISLFAVAVAFLKFCFLGPSSRFGEYRLRIALVALLIGCVLLRLLMPEIGE